MSTADRRKLRSLLKLRAEIAADRAAAWHAPREERERLAAEWEMVDAQIRGMGR